MSGLKTLSVAEHRHIINAMHMYESINSDFDRCAYVHTAVGYGSIVTISAGKQSNFKPYSVRNENRVKGVLKYTSKFNVPNQITGIYTSQWYQSVLIYKGYVFTYNVTNWCMRLADYKKLLKQYNSDLHIKLISEV